MRTCLFLSCLFFFVACLPDGKQEEHVFIIPSNDGPPPPPKSIYSRYNFILTNEGHLYFYELNGDALAKGRTAILAGDDPPIIGLQPGSLQEYDPALVQSFVKEKVASHPDGRYWFSIAVTRDTVTSNLLQEMLQGFPEPMKWASLIVRRETQEEKMVLLERKVSL